MLRNSQGTGIVAPISSTGLVLRLAVSTRASLSLQVDAKVNDWYARQRSSSLFASCAQVFAGLGGTFFVVLLVTKLRLCMAN